MKGRISKKRQDNRRIAIHRFCPCDHGRNSNDCGRNLGKYKICKRACWRYSAVGCVVDFKIGEVR